MKLTGIIGVIVVTFIVIVIAAFTYIHVESIRERQEAKSGQFIQGFLVTINKQEQITLDDKPVWVYQVNLSKHDSSQDKSEYLMIFEETYPPSSNHTFRFYYEELKQNNINYFWIIHIDQLW